MGGSLSDAPANPNLTASTTEHDGGYDKMSPTAPLRLFQPTPAPHPVKPAASSREDQPSRANSGAAATELASLEAFMGLTHDPCPERADAIHGTANPVDLDAVSAGGPHTVRIFDVGQSPYTSGARSPHSSPPFSFWKAVGGVRSPTSSTPYPFLQPGETARHLRCCSVCSSSRGSTSTELCCIGASTGTKTT
ncbi:hypothetical protein WJX72_000446 [[Myrmecia] bisecta]|uniref:Uncharacterized protein n=1 Tax=[Myrmecia] bisecta TaxID=41462 RepID=A0AAW1PA20_9CHLO